MAPSRLPTGSSDPIAFTCTCPTSSSPEGGLVLLFYRYFAASPPLTSTYEVHASRPSELAEFHTQLTQNLHLGGKIRIAREGFNITVGGTSAAIQKYIQACISHWSFANLDLDTDAKQRAFFKPSAGGCACVFGDQLAAVQIKPEITPMGITNYLPSDWEAVECLSPEDFHARCWERGRKVLIDLRNHYESRIGYFVDPVSGEKALTPAIRRFSQWPMFVRKHLLGSTLSSPSDTKSEEGNENKRQLMTYCTGGIRCEKGVRWMYENMTQREGDTVCTLKGGIAAYLTWMDEEISSGRKGPGDSLFKGRNYVFDARGSTGLDSAFASGLKPVSTCHVCTEPEDRLSKCRSQACHLVLVVCENCEKDKNPRCCLSCHDFDLKDGKGGKELAGQRPVCDCEKDREMQLWGGEQVKVAKPKKQQQGRKKGSVHDGGDIDIRIKAIY